MTARKGLGRGLASLIDDIQPNPEVARPADREVPIELIVANPDQPRKTFDESTLLELADSIRTHGIVQPLIVRPDPRRPDGFQLVAGERRWRAAQIVPLHSLPVIVRDYDDKDVLEIGVLENVQRSDLNALEEAAAYGRLIQTFGRSQEQIAKAIGKSRSHVANCLRLLNLPDTVKKELEAGRISAGHARALLSANDPDALCRQIIQRGLTVRETEKLAQQATAERPRKSRPPLDADTAALAADLGAALGMKVKIDHRGKSGSISLKYKSLDDLDALCQKLMG